MQQAWPGVVLFGDWFYNECYVKGINTETGHNGRHAPNPKKCNENRCDNKTRVMLSIATSAEFVVVYRHNKTSYFTPMATPGDKTKPELSSVMVETTAVEPETEDKKAKGGRPRRAPDVGLWTVRGVDLETRTAIEKAAQRNGKTIGQFVNEDLRQYAQEQIKKGSQPPMRQEDIRTELDDIKGMITQLADRLPAQEKRGFFQRLFS